MRKTGLALLLASWLPACSDLDPMLSAIESLRNVRVLAQKTEAFYGLELQLTAFERDQQPMVMMRWRNTSEQEVWWSAPRFGPGSSSGFWGAEFADGKTWHMGSGGGGHGPPKNRPPNREELQRWYWPPGRELLLLSSAPMSFSEADERMGELVSWHHSLPVRRPLADPPLVHYSCWKTVSISLSNDG